MKELDKFCLPVLHQENLFSHIEFVLPLLDNVLLLQNKYK